MPATFRGLPGAPVSVDVACPRMVGSVLPLDSQRGRKSRNKSKNGLRSRRPSNGRSNGRQQRPRRPDAALLAAAGKDLFREGLLMDGLYPKRHTPRHPAVSPNLYSIPEDTGALAFQATTDSQVILVLGDTLDRNGDVSPLDAARVSRGAELYWSTMRAYAEHQANAFCYLAPTGGEDASGGVLQTEAIRNELVAAGISPHHIMMDCSATSIMDNVIQLIPTLRHLRIQRLHVVGSDFQLPRVQHVVDQVLGAVPDMSFTVGYHAAQDVLSVQERANRAAKEQELMRSTQQPLEDVLRAMLKQRQRRSSLASTRSADSASSQSHPGLPFF